MRFGTADEWRGWLKRGWPLWWSLLFAGCGIVAWSVAGHSSDTVRRIGFAYESSGVLAVLLEFVFAMKRHGVAWPHLRLLTYCRDLPLLPRRGVVLRAEGASSGSSSGCGRMFVSLSDGATMEERVTFLEGQLKTVNDGLFDVERRLHAEVNERKAAIIQEAAQRERAASTAASAIRELEVGGLKLSLFGLLWLLVGMVMTTATQEVCSGLLRCA